VFLQSGTPGFAGTMSVFSPLESICKLRTAQSSQPADGRAVRLESGDVFIHKPVSFGVVHGPECSL
jgi:hypothetical protein